MRTETLMIASDLKNAGFGIEVLEKYNAVRVYLTRKLSVLPSQIRFALDQAGYEDCQFSISNACGSVYVRAVAA